MKWIGVALAVLGGYTAFSELFMQPETETGGLVFGVILLGIGLGMIAIERYKAKNPGSRYIIYENGIEHATRKAQTIMWWDDVTEISEAVTTIRPGGPIRELPISNQTFRISSWSIKDRNGLTMKLGSTQSLVSAVKHCVLEPRWASISSRIEAGETVQAGPAVLSADAVVLQGTAIPWSEIRQIRLHPPQVITDDAFIDWPLEHRGNHLNLLLLKRAVGELGT